MNDKVDIETDRKHVGAQRKSDIVSGLKYMIIFLVIHFFWVTKVWVHNGLEIQRKMEQKKKKKWKTTSPSAWEPLGRRWVSSSGLVFSDQGFNQDGACRDQEKWMDWVKIWRVDLF